jgi:hypothetical protein
VLSEIASMTNRNTEIVSSEPVIMLIWRNVA